MFGFMILRSLKQIYKNRGNYEEKNRKFIFNNDYGLR